MESNTPGSAVPQSPVAGGSFLNHRQAALALLSECPKLSHKEAGFLGHVCVADVLSDRQSDWLAGLLDRNGLPQCMGGTQAGGVILL